MRIEKLTIEEYREKYFWQAVSTEPADRARAEAAALKIAKIVGVEINSVEWVDSPKLMASLWASLGDSLGASLGSSLMDTGWLAFYSFCADELKIKIDDTSREKLRLHNEIAASCFALWIVPGTIILCERPSRIEITDGKLVGIECR
jgi:hypothetical protein